MQPSKPSFLQYFEQQEADGRDGRGGGGGGEVNADQRRLPTDVDLQVVSVCVCVR